MLLAVHLNISVFTAMQPTMVVTDSMTKKLKNEL